MPVSTIYTLGENQVTVSAPGNTLDGVTQGSGIHLTGSTITLNSNAWQAIDVFDNDSNFADNDTSQTLEGDQAIDGIVYTDGSIVEAEYEFDVQDPDGNIYTLVAFNVREPGAPNSYGTIEAVAFVGGVAGFPPRDVTLTVVDTAEGPSFPFLSLATPPCFTLGSEILTPRGNIAIEDLEVGDEVVTLDHGIQQIRWIGRKRFPNSFLQLNHDFRPIVIKAHAFGPDMPSRATRLSRQHRVKISGWRAEMLFGEDEILVPISKLINDDTILTDSRSIDVEYFHLLFDQHEIIFADGLASESYLANSINDNCAETARELLAIFPELPNARRIQTAARPCYSDKRTALLFT